MKNLVYFFSLPFFGTFFGVVFFVFLRFPKNECISSKTKAIYPKFSGTRSRTQNTNVIFYPHGFFFVLPWMGVSGFVDSKSSNVFGGES